ncbi:MAG TPA: hypothetical protein VN862_05330 [Candidatus Acidoferrales bacterium]|nr:hypothetical protein [Candidatus Acidoferrales bacterium]
MPPVAPFTAQLTAAFERLATVAVNWVLPPNGIDEIEGEMLTLAPGVETGGGEAGGGEVANPPPFPEQPASSTEQMASAIDNFMHSE